MDDELTRLREKRLRELVAAQKRPPGGEVLTATRGNFSSLVSTWPYLVVDCWAPWCGPCRRVGPVIEALAGEFSGKIAFAKLNTDEHPQVAARYGISAIPTLLLFRSGSLAGRITGA
ncbi:MAG TPA: thioredoxin domain-containing protein, partial [Methanoregulaceae archaeon]|nr:thioredoxin domain-containing protein [Methanoregulaceae archaeon]